MNYPVTQTHNISPVKPPAWSFGIPFFLRKRLPTPQPDPQNNGSLAGQAAYKIGRRVYRHVHMQDEKYTFCDWDLIHSVIAKAYREWFPQFKDVVYDCNDYTWRAKGRVDAVLFARILEMLASVAMGAVHENLETAKMAFCYSWITYPDGSGHMRNAGFDKESGLQQYEPQVIARGPFPMAHNETGYLIMG